MLPLPLMFIILLFFMTPNDLHIKLHNNKFVCVVCFVLEPYVATSLDDFQTFGASNLRVDQTVKGLL